VRRRTVDWKAARELSCHLPTGRSGRYPALPGAVARAALFPRRKAAPGRRPGSNRRLAAPAPAPPSSRIHRDLAQTTAAANAEIARRTHRVQLALPSVGRAKSDTSRRIAAENLRCRRERRWAILRDHHLEQPIQQRVQEQKHKYEAW